MIKVASYLRLSREEGDKMESDSIANQRALIKEYLKKEPEMVLVEEFSDDGFTGTSFDRPAFIRMIAAARMKRFTCIIVKDLSRFGRNYIESGRYLERIFPMLGIRFISILDNYDTGKDDGSGQLIIEIKNIINDAYCRDISMKIRSSLDNKRKEGQFIGSFAPYGYRKDEENKNHLVIDKYPAQIVQDIFRMKLDGYGTSRIVKKLNETGAHPPLEYKRMCGLNYNSGFRGENASKWSITTVMRILKNEMYTGTMVQNKMKKINYKIKESRPVCSISFRSCSSLHSFVFPLG